MEISKVYLQQSLLVSGFVLTLTSFCFGGVTSSTGKSLLCNVAKSFFLYTVNDTDIFRSKSSRHYQQLRSLLIIVHVHTYWYIVRF